MTIAELMVLMAAIMPYVIAAMHKQAKAYDNADPRNKTNLDGEKLRAYNAHLNSFEVFPFFAFAVLSCEFRHVNQLLLTVLTILFIVVRILYVRAYLADKPNNRSSLFSVGLLIVLVIFLLPLTTLFIR